MNGDDDAAAPERHSTRRWLLGIGLTVVLNLAVTVAAFGGLYLQQRSFDLEQAKAVTEQLTIASELVSRPEDTAQAAGFRMLARVAQVSPGDQGRVLDLAEAYIVNDRPVARRPEGYTDERQIYVANTGTQAAVDVIRSRTIARDPGGPGQRAFNLPGLVVEAVRFHDVVMRKTQGQACTGRKSEWDRADLRGSDFWSCGFKWARFVDANLHAVQLQSSVLEDADFTNADLTGADLDGVVINAKTVFRGADLGGATFAGTDLSSADFAGVKSIAGADFSRAKGVERARNLRNAQGAQSALWPH